MPPVSGQAWSWPGSPWPRRASRHSWSWACPDGFPCAGRGWPEWHQNGALRRSQSTGYPTQARCLRVPCWLGQCPSCGPLTIHCRSGVAYEQLVGHGSCLPNLLRAPAGGAKPWPWPARARPVRRLRDLRRWADQKFVLLRSQAGERETGRVSMRCEQRQKPGKPHGNSGRVFGRLTGVDAQVNASTSALGSYNGEVSRS